MDKSMFSFGFFRAEVRCQNPEEMTADMMIFFVAPEALSPPSAVQTVGSVWTRLRNAARVLALQALWGPTEVRRGQPLKPSWGKELSLPDVPRTSWRDLILRALQSAHEGECEVVCLVLERPSDPLPVGTRWERAETLAREVRDAVLSFFAYTPLTKVVVVKLLVARQPEFATALRVALDKSLVAAQHAREGRQAN